MRSQATLIERDDNPGAGLSLVIIAPDSFGAIALPAEGSLTIGRSSKVDVMIDDPLASRQHAVLRVGPSVTIEDLGSANGTKVGGQLIPRTTPVPLSPGDSVNIGSTLLVLQRGQRTASPRRVVSHQHFEARLADACVQNELGDAPFALLRIRLERATPASVVMPLFAREAPLPHLFASYGPDDYELLLFERDDAAVAQKVATLLAELDALGAKPRAGVAHHPRDGRSAEALLAHVSQALRAQARAGQTPGPVRSASLQRIYALAERAAPRNINVLILGETGVGKEVLATAIHRLSPRAEHKLLALNCAGLTESLIESELFGHERGSFTGATASKPGLLEAADGGTVFLDEIGEMPLTLQAKLLRVIEAREVTRVGAVKARPIDVRFVAATNRDLEKEVARSRFRRDLFFRLNGLSLTIPPLRERLVELPTLIAAFIEEFSVDSRRTPPRFSDEAMEILRAYDWPGNVRELRNVVERALVLCEGPVMGLEHLPLEKLSPPEPPPVFPRPDALADLPPLADEHKERERQGILEALASCAGNQSRAARMLGMPRRTFIYKLETYGIARPVKGG